MHSGFDWTHKYPAIAEAVVALDARRAYPDGGPRARRADGIYLRRVARTSVMNSKNHRLATHDEEGLQSEG
jgi:hypothetical protein